ncbi:methyl-accepting chemotaxis protein [Marinobacterium jannaschii]|uniref:methyl-accepting chemotaxis protein n=1 Tax=Marinobacterium jannaschii TaxID=64970 RepID=UPI0004875BEF|nr:methyl-accepting chemotaxis protein [Marinobacterium jannaschii]
MLIALLSPAIRLMNRLNYLYKFTLINVLFLIPLLSLAYMQLDEISESQQVTRTELGGIETLRKAVALVATASELRDLTVVQGSGFELEAKLNGLQARYSDGLSNLELDIASLERAEKLKELISRLHQLGAEERGAGTLNEAAIFVNNNALVLESWILVHRLSYETGVYQDRDPYNFLLMKAVLDGTEALLEHQGQQRAFSTRVVKAGVVNSGVMETLNRVMDALIDDQKRLSSSLRPILSAQDVFGRELIARAEATAIKLKQGAERFENDILIDENLDHNWQQYFQQESDTGAAIYDFIYGALDFVEARLRSRDSAQNHRYYGLLAVVLTVFLLTNYLMLAFNLSVRNSMQAILDAAERVTQGDMTSQVQISNRDELGTLATRFNQMTERMRSLLSQVTSTVESVASQAGVVDGIARQSSEATEAQRRETDQVAAAISQMAGSAQEVAAKTLIASQESEEVDRKAAAGQQLVTNTLEDINQLSRDIDHAMKVIHQLVQDSGSITQVLDVIKGVAEQTNLLALNAAIEAARAGEQGRGFAVVADEVRTLAQRTQESTAVIDEMITRLQIGVNDAVRAMEVSHEKVGQTVINSAEVGRTLEGISGAISRIVEFNAQIASAGEEQTLVANEIERNVRSISDVSNQTAEGAKGTVAACQQMTGQAGELQTVVATFKV